MKFSDLLTEEDIQRAEAFATEAALKAKQVEALFSRDTRGWAKRVVHDAWKSFLNAKAELAVFRGEDCGRDEPCGICIKCCRRYKAELAAKDEEIAQLQQRNEWLETQVKMHKEVADNQTWHVQSLRGERDRLKDSLTNFYDKWENGTPCIEADENGIIDCGSNLGNAVNLSVEEEQEILNLIVGKAEDYEQACANCDKPYRAHLLHLQNKCHPSGDALWMRSAPPKEREK